MHQLIARLSLRDPIAAYWLAALARIELDAELLVAALRLYPEECASA